MVDDDQESAAKAAAGGRFSRKLNETESESGTFLVTADVECCLVGMYSMYDPCMISNLEKSP